MTEKQPARSVQIAEVIVASVARGRRLIAHSAEAHPMGEDYLDAVNALTDLMHAVAALGEDPVATVEHAAEHYKADVTGGW